MASLGPLGKLPIELVGLTCSFLSTGDALSLCRSSKSLYRIVHPLLFRHVTIKWNQCARPRSPPNITSLLQFILRNPDYAKYIKTVDVPDVVYDACVAWSRRLQDGNPWHWTPQDKALARAAIEEGCRLAHPDDWYEAVVERANLGAITALILAHCTHLESLTLDVSFIPTRNGYFDDMLRPVIIPSLSRPEPPARPPVLPRLAHLTITQNDMRILDYMDEPDRELFDGAAYLDPQGEPPESLFLFFYLPRLTTIHFDYEPWGDNRLPWDPTSYYYDGLHWPLAYPPQLASLKVLRLDHIFATSDTIRFLLQHTPSLQSLVYDCKLPSSCSPLNLINLREGLEHVRGTLTHLVIRYEIGADSPLDLATLSPVMTGPVMTGSLGALDSFAALESLEISPFLLLGQVPPQAAAPLAAVLPARLKRLALNDDLWLHHAFDAWRGEQLEAMLVDFLSAAGGAWKTATPLLEEFIFEFVQDELFTRSALHVYWNDVVNRARFLQMIGEGQGIKCAFRLYPGIEARYRGGEVRYEPASHTDQNSLRRWV